MDHAFKPPYYDRSAKDAITVIFRAYTLLHLPCLLGTVQALSQLNLKVNRIST